jgi:nucleotide-binding universal stress UspA family protein/RimJ/RimL family protein N-acetyltransferase
VSAGQETALKDGTPVLIRPIEPTDRAALAEGFARLSPESRYRRFFSPVSELRDRDLDYLTQVDHHEHEALVAVDPVSGEGLGVARFVRIAPSTAEPAIVVADDWQGRGVASVLLDALVARAREEGIERFHAPILATNTDAIHIFERLGHATKQYAGHEVELDIALPPARGGELGPPLLRPFAAGIVAPARTLLDLLHPRRRGSLEDARRNLIVVGTDGSEHAARAVEATGAIASAADSIVAVVGVHPMLVPAREEVAAAVKAAATQLRGRGLHVYELLRRGEAALALADIAEEEGARLVVVGAGEHSALARRLLGGTADGVLQRAPCDVLVVRPRVRVKADA